MQHKESYSTPVHPSGDPPVYTNTMPVTGESTEPSLGSLLTELTDDMGRLVRQEIELARVETTQKISRATRSIVLMVVGGLIAYAGFITLLITAAIALGALMPYWLSSLLVGVVVLLVGAILLGSGRSSLSNMTVVPKNTVESIKEDARWAKEQVS
jgi:uncharacterized membrane protein YqjE